MDSLSPEVVDLLRAGAADGLGYCCRPSQIEKLYPAIQAAERAGYLRWIGEHPWITEAGRKAIGAPTEAEADRARRIKLCSVRTKLVPAKRDDPRTDFDYRSYRSMDYVCTLLVKQPDARENPTSIRVGRSLNSDPQFLGPRNSIILPESEGRFVLALMPSWLLRRALLPTYPYPLDDEDPAFTAEERVAWNRLRQVCHSVNARIRAAGRRQSERFRYGESA
jgi:hypothetical protein